MSLSQQSLENRHESLRLPDLSIHVDPEGAIESIKGRDQLVRGLDCDRAESPLRCQGQGRKALDCAI